MRLVFKQRLFSWFDSYDVYDEDGNTVYVVKGELSWGHRLQIYDAYGNRLGTVQEKVFTWRPKFELYVGDRQVGECTDFRYTQSGTIGQGKYRFMLWISQCSNSRASSSRDRISGRALSSFSRGICRQFMVRFKVTPKRTE